MADQELQKGNLQPTAQPVSTFLQFQQQNIPAPASQVALPQAQGIVPMQRMGESNVQGYNQAAQLAEALAPFSSKLIETIKQGYELYATEEYQQGKNQATRAAINLDKQMQNSEILYADDNRSLERKDQKAAIMMDNLNPYRKAGVQRKFSELAAFEVGPAMQSAYLDMQGELLEIENNDTQLNSVRSSALQKVIKKYNLTEDSPGFMELVLPQVNKAWESIQSKHIKDRAKYLKDASPDLDATKIIGLFITENNQDGSITTDEQKIQWASDVITQTVKKLGLGGEPADYTTKTIEKAQAIAKVQNRPDLLRLLGKVKVGPITRGADGELVQSTAELMYGPEMFIIEDKFNTIQARNKEQEDKKLAAKLNDDLMNTIMQIDPGPARGQAIVKVINKVEYSSLSFGTKAAAASQANSLINEYISIGDDTESMDNFLQGVSTRYGSAWNAKQADTEFAEKLSGVKNPKTREEYRRKYMAARKTQDDLSQSINGQFVDAQVREFTKAILIQKYPDLETAALAGNPEALNNAINGTSKSNAAKAGYQITNELKTAAYVALGNAMAAKQGKLSNFEQQKIIADTLTDVTKNKNFGLLLPGIGNTPSANPSTRSTQPSKGTKLDTRKKYDVTALDNIPDRENALKGPGAILNFADTQDMLGAALNNNPLPAALKRAAKDAGMTPEEFIIKQVESYPANIKITPDQRKQLINQGNKNKALKRYNTSQSNMPSTGTALQTAMNWLGNMLTAPAVATTLPQPAIRYSNTPAPQRFTATNNRGNEIIKRANKFGINPLDVAAIISFETGGTFNTREPGLGAAAGRIGLIQMGPVEMKDYGSGSGIFSQELDAVFRYFKDRGVKAGMGIADIYSAVNNGRAWLGYTPDGNGVVPRSKKTQDLLQQHRKSAAKLLGLVDNRQNFTNNIALNNTLQTFKGNTFKPAKMTSGFGAKESFRTHKHEGQDIALMASTKLGFAVGGKILNIARTNSRASGANGGYGSYIDVELNNGMIVRMAHLSQIPASLVKGSTFGANQVIAFSGGAKGAIGSGRTTGPHLHYEQLTRQAQRTTRETTYGKIDPVKSGLNKLFRYEEPSK